MAAARGLQQPLIDTDDVALAQGDPARESAVPAVQDLVPWNARRSGGVAQLFVKGVMRARYGPAAYDILSYDEQAQKVVWPLFTLMMLMATMLLSTAGAIFQLHHIYNSPVNDCVAYEHDLIPFVIEKSEWNRDHIQNFMLVTKNGFSEVNYEYVLVSGKDSKGEKLVIKDQAAPWEADVSKADFPILLTFTCENAWKVAKMIWPNVVAQLTNPLWLLLSCTSLLGWFHVPVLAPCGHVLQLASGTMVLFSAVWALQSPPEALPPMSEAQLQSFYRCSGNSMVLQLYGWTLLLQTLVGVLLVPAAALVATPFRHLGKLAATRCKIKVNSVPKDCDSTCSICLTPVSPSGRVQIKGGRQQSNGSNNSDDAPDDDLWTLPCSHTFHRHCILPWLCHQKGESLGNCPECRADPFTIVARQQGSTSTV